MKNNILFILFFAILFSSCEGVFNPEDSYGDISGIWDVEETSITYGSQLYDVQISYIDDNSVRIYNFYGLGSWVFLEAQLNDNILSFVDQVVEGHKLTGQGEIEDDYKVINFEFTVEEVSNSKTYSPENVSAIYTRN